MRLKIGILAFALLFALGGSARALDQLRLVTGKIIEGEVLKENERFITFRMANFGIMQIAKDKVKEIGRGQSLAPEPDPTPLPVETPVGRIIAAPVFSSRLNVGGKQPEWMTKAAEAPTTATAVQPSADPNAPSAVEGAASAAAPAAPAVDPANLAARLLGGEAPTEADLAFLKALAEKAQKAPDTLSGIEKKIVGEISKNPELVAKLAAAAAASAAAPPAADAPPPADAAASTSAPPAAAAGPAPTGDALYEAVAAKFAKGDVLEESDLAAVTAVRNKRKSNPAALTPAEQKLLDAISGSAK